MKSLFAFLLSQIVPELFCYLDSTFDYGGLYCSRVCEKTVLSKIVCRTVAECRMTTRASRTWPGVRRAEEVPGGGCRRPGTAVRRRITWPSEEHSDAVARAARFQIVLRYSRGTCSKSTMNFNLCDPQMLLFLRRLTQLHSFGIDA